MTAETLFKVLKGSYHDGALLDAKLIQDTLYLYCFRNPPDFDNKEDPNYRYVVIRFDGVTDLYVYDWRESETYVPYTDSSFRKPHNNYWAISGIDSLSCEDGVVEFDESLRFSCDSVELLEHSSDEIDFSKYFI